MRSLVIKHFEGPAPEFAPCPDLPDREVHLWQLDLPETLADSAALTLFDLREANRLADHAEGVLFLRARAKVREIAGRYLQVPALEVCCGEDAAGKWLGGGGRHLRYAMESAGDSVSVALSARTAIPLALESVRTGFCLDDLATNFLEPAEAWQVIVARGDERAAIFYELWTRALVASGQEGREVVSFVHPGGAVGALELPGSHWTVRDFTEDRAFCGRVAA